MSTELGKLPSGLAVTRFYGGTKNGVSLQLAGRTGFVHMPAKDIAAFMGLCAIAKEIKHPRHAVGADEWWKSVKQSHLKALGLLPFEAILKGAVISAYNAGAAENQQRRQSEDICL